MIKNNKEVAKTITVKLLGVGIAVIFAGGLYGLFLLWQIIGVKYGAFWQGLVLPLAVAITLATCILIICIISEVLRREK